MGCKPNRQLAGHRWLLVWCLLVTVSCTDESGHKKLSEPDTDLTQSSESLTHSTRTSAEFQIHSTIEELQARVANSPENPRAHGELAMAYDANGFKAHAQSSYRKAIQLEPTAFRWHYLLAIRLQKDGELNQAFVSLDRAQTLNIEYPALYIRRGQWVFDSGNFELALASFEQAHLLDASPAALVGIAASLIKLNRQVDANQILSELASTTEHPVVWRLFATTERALGNEERARQLMRRGESSRQIWFSDPIAEELDQYAASVTGRLQAVQGLLATAQTEDALTQLQQLATKDPGNLDVLYQLGLTHIQLGNFDTAKQHLLQAIKLEPVHYPSHLLLASLYQRVDANVLAADHLMKVVAVYPLLNIAHQELAFVQLRLSDKQGALESFERAIAADSTEPNVHYYAGVLHGEQGECVKALTHFNNTVYLNPNHLKAHLGAATCRVQLGNHNEARKLVERARELGATHAEVQVIHDLMNES